MQRICKRDLLFVDFGERLVARWLGKEVSWRTRQVAPGFTIIFRPSRAEQRVSQNLIYFSPPAFVELGISRKGSQHRAKQGK